MRMSDGGGATQWTYDRKKIRNFSIIGACGAIPGPPMQNTAASLLTSDLPSHPSSLSCVPSSARF